MRVYFFCIISSYQILRQFEALMGGSLHAPRQDTASSSHQAATTNQLPTSTYSGPLLPTHSTGITNLNHYQPDTSLTGVAQPPNHPSSPSSLALAQRDSSGEVTNDGVEEKLSPIQQQLEVQPVRTAEVKLVAEESELNRGSSHPAEPHSEQPCLSRLSLFSGMELVTKGRPLCGGETSQTGNSLRENLAVHNISISDGAPPICSLVVADSSQPVSAFSFLNF